MKEKQDYIRDLAEIRSMMERSSKFLSLSGWAGIMAGIYALSGAFIAYSFLNFNPDSVVADTGSLTYINFPKVILLAVAVLAVTLGTAIYLSRNNAKRKGESVWNSASKQLLVNIAVPLAAGGILSLVFISYNLLGLIAPLTLLFYGLAIFNAGRFTYAELKVLGLIEITLGLLGSWFIEYGLFLWALGFGIVHIIYGVYLHSRYER